ncbi:MAG: hypothetical protein HYX68_21150 [Planctomycetes bacterium]|nr:hypothetical protein [Planctomycetota bacterium]
MRCIKNQFVLAGFVALAWFWLVPGARADDAYYMVIFAYQGNPKVPRLAHSFATFVKVPQDKDGKALTSRCEIHSISWIAATWNVSLLRAPERGKNFDLPSTMRQASAVNAQVTAWGPYRIKKELYDKALAQIIRLESGKIAYKALDRGLRRDIATNCFHAISDLVDGPLLETGTAFGNAASEMVRDHLAPWIIDRKTTHRFLLEPLGLTKYTINYRE